MVRNWWILVAAVLGVWWLHNWIPEAPPHEQMEAVHAPDLAHDHLGRSGAWPRVRREHLDHQPACVACDSRESLNVHHIKPYHDSPELELDPDNLVTLCRRHHFYLGHDPDGPKGPAVPDWHKANPDVLRDAAIERRRLGLS